MIVDNIEFTGRLRAIALLRGGSEDIGTEFVTHPEAVLQLGQVAREKGAIVRGHYHLPMARETYCGPAPECFVVVRGLVRVLLYDEVPTLRRVVTLSAGDTLLLFAVTHALEFLEESVLVEVKYGPHLNDKEYHGSL